MPTVLIADFSEKARESLAQTLRGEGCDVVEARDGASAMAEAVRVRPDLIFLDVNMPDTSGREMLPIIRNTPALRLTPVILLSTFIESGDCYYENDKFPAGYTVFLLKPVQTTELLSVIRMLLRPRRLDENRDMENQES